MFIHISLMGCANGATALSRECYSRTNLKPRGKRHYEGLHLHELRHTYATQLLANGVDYKTVQYLLGHAYQ